MSVRTTHSENVVALFDSVSGFAFGPTFPNEEAAADFLQFTNHHPDLRTLDDVDLMKLYVSWIQRRGSLFGLELGR